MDTLTVAMELVDKSIAEVWPLERDDVELALQMSAQHPTLGARDLCHLASCRRRGIRRVKTFDRYFRAIVGEA